MESTSKKTKIQKIPAVAVAAGRVGLVKALPHSSNCYCGFIGEGCEGNSGHTVIKTTMATK